MLPLKCKRHLLNVSPGGAGIMQPDLLILELLDEKEIPVVRAGHAGEVTITTLGVEGMPLLRYKTGDICIADESAMCLWQINLTPLTGGGPKKTND